MMSIDKICNVFVEIGFDAILKKKRRKEESKTYTDPFSEPSQRCIVYIACLFTSIFVTGIMDHVGFPSSSRPLPTDVKLTELKDYHTPSQTDENTFNY